MPRSIIDLALEKESATECNSEIVQTQTSLPVAFQSSETASVNECNNDSSLSVASESQLRDITEVLEIQSRSLICSTNAQLENENDRDDDENDGDALNSHAKNNDKNDDMRAKRAIGNNQQPINPREPRSASVLGESCSNSCYSTSSSSLPSNDNGSDQITETNQVVSSSSPSSATVTVSTCPSCGSENAEPCSKLSLSSTSSSSPSPHRRYSSELNSSKKWKSYSRPEMINSKSSYRSSPYKIKSHCSNSSFKQSSRHHGHSHHHHRHHHHNSHHHNHRLNTRSSTSKKHSLASELDMIRSKSKSKRERYSYSKSSISDNARCHVCKQVEHDETRLHSFNQRSSSTSTIKGTDCPYSLTPSSYDDDHLMSHLCDIDSWHRRRKRETLKKKERAIIAILSIIAILIFIAMSYFGTILFLRITTMPIS